MEILPAKILSIDDETVLRESIVCYLEDSGFDVLEACNGKEGLEVFREEKPDLILSDLQMPVMGGLDLLKVITKESPDTPIIVVSGAGVMDDAIAALRLGAWDYLVKPINDMAVLEHSIVKCLEKQRLITENERIRRTLQEDQEAGRSVQEKILPPKRYEGKRFFLEQSVMPSLYLSGDFVDYFELDERYFIFYLADVSGHGSSAAFLTILIKTFIRDLKTKYQTENDHTLLEPTALLNALSNEVYAAKLGKYLTLLYFVYDQQENKLIYSVGGHYPNPILVKEGSAFYLPGKGFPIGIMNNAKYSQEELSLDDPCQIGLFSDGLYEVIDGDFDEKEVKHLSVMGQNFQNIDDCIDAFNYRDMAEKPDDISVMLFNFKG